MLKLLLDEHISPDVAKGLRRLRSALIVYAMPVWEAGTFLGRPDDVLLREAAAQKLTLVTYDQKTIPPLLKEWAQQGIMHGGVIFVDDRTIAPGNIGGLVRSLADLANELQHDDWENRVVFLRR